MAHAVKSATSIRDNFRLILGILVIWNLLFLVTVSATSDREDSVVLNDKLVSVENDSNDIDLNGSDGSSEPEEDGDDHSEGESLDLAGKKFDWRHHHDNHEVYAGRSLMTAYPSEHNVKVTSDREEEDEIEEAKKENSNRVNANADELDPLGTIDFAEKEWQLMFRAFDSAVDGVSTSIFQEIGRQTNLFDDIVSSLKPACRRDINYIRESVKKHKLWALRMLDSNGKIPSGVTYGRFSAPGDYEECLGVQVDDTLFRDVAKNVVEKYKFHGKYCLLDFRLPLPERPANKLLSIHESVLNFTETELGKNYPDMIGNYSAYASVFYEVGYLHAFCLPSSCDVTDLTRAIGRAIEGTYVLVNNTIDCEERPPDETQALRTSQVIALFLLSVVFLNSIVATVGYYLLTRDDFRERRRQRRKSSQLGRAGGDSRAHQSEEAQLAASALLSSKLKNRFYVDCFSIQKNFERLTKPDPRGLTFVHYTRIVAMAFTVITHTGALGTLQAITKPADASNSEQIFRDLLPQMLANAFTSIQIFFFMAGFMLVISTYPSIYRDKGHISFLEHAVKRAIRLLPGIAATICLNFLWPLVVDGPMVKYFIRMIVVPCEQNWWRTLAFLSNFDHVEKMCLRHSYFSASDYQLHIIAFPLLILLYKRPGFALFMAALLTVGGFVAQTIMVLTKTVLPFMMVDYIDKQAFFNVVHYIHHPVWNHTSAFFYGFIVGYLVVKRIRFNLSATAIKRIWYILMPAGIMSIFAPYFWNHYKRPIHKWQIVLYVIFDRLILLTTCAWLSYASMVLARKPAPPAAAKKKIEGPKNGATNLATIELQRPAIVLNAGTPGQNLAVGQDSPTILPRQRSSPNLAYLQQQQQQPPPNPPDQADSLRRLSKAISSSNLATIAETGQEQAKENKGSHALEPVTCPRAPPVSNMNTLCLVLSRLTFQLYLFNMVVLWVDVNNSKYYWFFSYYFIIIKAAAVYICSALMAMIFFVALESPCLTLYIAWVKGRAAARAKRQQAAKLEATIARLNSPGDKQILGHLDSPPPPHAPNMPTTKKPTLSFIDLSTTPDAKGPDTASLASGALASSEREASRLDQTRM